MTTVNTDAKFNGLGGFGYTGAQEDRELKFYQANGATSNNLPDAELQFLTLQGYPTGTSEDRWFAYLTSLGYKGSVDDMIKPWWSVGPGVGYLFTGGAPGVWYDPSDYSTLFQDSAGTTPVTAVEQPVGLMLDKSQGLVLGGDVVVNGNFSGGSTGWVTTTGWTIAGGSANGVATSAFLYQTNANILVNRYYEVTFTVSNYVAGSVRPFLGATVTYGTFVSGNGTYTQRFCPTAAGNELGFSGSGFTGSIDNISVKEVTGNHAFQSTSASRPVLSARYNLLTKTEQFDDAAWVPSAVSITANSIIAPNGTQTADTLTTTSVFNSFRQTADITVTASTTYTLSFYAYRGTATDAKYSIFNSTAGSDIVASTSYFSQTVAGAWSRVTLTFTTPVGCTSIRVFLLRDTGVLGSIFLWGAQLVVTNSLTSNAYQRVNTATDYATTGFLPYLKFDGVDDSLSTNSISFTSTDKMSVFAGVRKLSDAAQALVVGLGNITQSGAMELFAPTSAAGNEFNFAANGGVTFVQASAGSRPSPISVVAAGLIDFSLATGEVVNRINGVVAATSSGNAGSANFRSDSLQIGRRGGLSLPFNGQLYSMVIVGKAVTASELTNTENFVNRKTGAY